MSDSMIPLSEAAALVVELLSRQEKKAELLDADAKPSQTVKKEKPEDKDVKVKDVELDNTDGGEAAKEWSEGMAPVVDEFTNAGDDTEAEDDASAVKTERGSQKAAEADLNTDDTQTDFLEDDMETLLNDQVAYEIYSAYIYYAVAAWSDSKGLSGFYCWFKGQGDGEMCHAMKLMKYLIDTGSKLTFPAIESPKDIINFTKMSDATGAVLKHEMSITEKWKKIGELAKSQPNLATQQLAQWFMTEQVEEEDVAVKLHQKVQMSDNGAGILIIDSDLAKG